MIPCLLWKCASLPVVHFLASIFSGDLCLPSEDEVNVSIDDEIKCLINDGKPLRYFHSYFDKEWLDVKELASLSGFRENPGFIEKLFEENFKVHQKNQFQFKNVEYHQIGSETFVELE